MCIFFIEFDRRMAKLSWVWHNKCNDSILFDWNVIWFSSSMLPWKSSQCFELAVSTIGHFKRPNLIGYGNFDDNLWLFLITAYCIHTSFSLQLIRHFNQFYLLLNNFIAKEIIRFNYFCLIPNNFNWNHWNDPNSLSIRFVQCNQTNSWLYQNSHLSLQMTALKSPFECNVCS